MLNRRGFLEATGLSSLGWMLRSTIGADNSSQAQPIVMSTWAPNAAANMAAWEVLREGGAALDAVERGVQVPESDPSDQSVGYGGLPDREGKVTLDACIMDGRGNCGAVMFLEGIRHAIRIARLVMEKTPHVQLVGEGALRLALENGYRIENLLTPQAEKAWKQWLQEARYDPMTIPKLLQQQGIKDGNGQQHNHDTIGMLALDRAGFMGGACSTSGMAYKMRGRVGDSPIIGAGLFVDDEAGAATCSGVGEEVLRICGAHTVVEYLRQGHDPESACRKTLERLIRKRGKKARDLQVGFIALNNKGQYGACALQKGFTVAVHSGQGSRTFEAKSFF